MPRITSTALVAPGGQAWEGSAFTLFTTEDQPRIDSIESLIGQAIPRLVIQTMTTEKKESSPKPRPSKRRAKKASQPEQPQQSLPEQSSPEQSSPKQSSPVSWPSDQGNATMAAYQESSDEEESPQIGMGKHVPAFMLRTAIASDSKHHKAKSPKSSS